MARARGQQPREFVLTLWGGHTAFGGATPTPAEQRARRRRRPDRQPACSPPGSSPVAQGVETNSLVGLLRLVRVPHQRVRRVLQPDARPAARRRLPARGGRLGGHQEPAHGHRRGRVGRARRRRRRVRLGAACCRSCRAASRRSTTSSGPRSSAPSSGRAPPRPCAAAAPRRPSASSRVASVGRRAVGVGHTESLAHAGALAAAAGAEEVVILSPDGRPAAYVDRAAAASVPADAAGTTPGDRRRRPAARRCGGRRAAHRARQLVGRRRPRHRALRRSWWPSWTVAWSA